MKRDMGLMRLLLLKLEDEDIWNKTKEGALAAGGFSFDLVKDLAKGFIRKKVETLTGVDL